MVRHSHDNAINQYCSYQQTTAAMPQIYSTIHNNSKQGFSMQSVYTRKVTKLAIVIAYLIEWTVKYFNIEWIGIKFDSWCPEDVSGSLW